MTNAKETAPSDPLRAGLAQLIAQWRALALKEIHDPALRNSDRSLVHGVCANQVAALLQTAPQGEGMDRFALAAVQTAPQQETAEKRWRVGDTIVIPGGPIPLDLTGLQTTPPATPLNRFDCLECGQGIGVDEDGCCRSCGRDATAMIDGVPASLPAQK